MKYIPSPYADQSNLHEKIVQELSTYPEKTVHPDGSVTVEQVNNDYFLVNDAWNINFVGGIKQFKESVENYKWEHKNVHFRFTSPTINLEIKYIWYHKLFRDEWNLTSILHGGLLFKLTSFMNEEHPSLRSLLDLDIDKAEREWLFWLRQQGVETKSVQRRVSAEYKMKTSVAYFLRAMHSSLLALTDTREEWEKDKWDVRILHDQFGIDYNKSKSMHLLDFTRIEPINVREQVKKYIKQRLMSKKFSWARAQYYVPTLSYFFSFIFSLEPSWTDLRTLTRSHMEQYLQWLHEYARKNKCHPNYTVEPLGALEKFLGDIQQYEYDIAPKTHVRLLLFSEDRPRRVRKSVEQISYIPDYVLEQLFTHINDLKEEVIPVVWTAFKTGLRISDVLGLTTNCLTRLNGKYSIVTDIEKTYVKGHRIPIDDELANIIAVLIHESKERSNQDNNPEQFIFIRYHGSRKGKPFQQNLVRTALNQLAKDKNIVDENGELFHFKTHQFRHTYAIKMLNGGADILTVQELLAHASPEMTMRYARLLDDTKRKAFEKVIKAGVFTFDLDGKVHDVLPDEDVPEEVMDMLWRNEKLNAIDNPYGSCRARVNGNCPIAVEPPCLTANNGKPCFDLAVGISDMDIKKYELHIDSTSKMIEAAKQFGREDMVEANERNLKRYQEIYETIKNGNVIFGRIDRIRRELDKKKGVKRA